MLIDGEVVLLPNSALVNPPAGGVAGTVVDQVGGTQLLVLDREFMRLLDVWWTEQTPQR